MEGRNALLTVLLFAASLFQVFADHFRGGHLSWLPTDQPGQVSGSVDCRSNTDTLRHATVMWSIDRSSAE